MKTINLRFVSGWSFADALIRWRSNGLYTHVGAITDNGLYEYGARIGVDGALSHKPGVQVRPQAYKVFNLNETLRIPCTDDEHAKFWAALAECEGKAYSELEIIGDAIGHNFRVRGAFVCSALQTYALTKARITPKIERGRAEMITPDWLYGFAVGLKAGRMWEPFKR